MNKGEATQDAVLRIGEVCGVDGRRIFVLVDRQKNLSDVFLDGDILRNISVNSYVEIRKGFLSIIARVEGERIDDEPRGSQFARRENVGPGRRVLTLSLTGYIDETGVFSGGTRELPLLGNEAYVITRAKMHQVHNLATPGAPAISIATVFGEDFLVDLPIDGLFNSHIAIFGNTGSGKSNTLACLYQELVRVLSSREHSAFTQNTKFILFDFNGEYASSECITSTKHVYNLSTRGDAGDKIPMDRTGLLDLEVLSILSDATEKTQKPFLRRSLRLLHRIHGGEIQNAQEYLRAIIIGLVERTLQMSDKIRAFQLLDYFRELLQIEGRDNDPLASDLDWHNQSQEFFLTSSRRFLKQQPEAIKDTNLYEAAAEFVLPEDLLCQLETTLYIQLIQDVLANRAQNEHIAPVINRLKSKRGDIGRLFQLEAGEFWPSNFVVVNLNDVNLAMKKTLPLLLAKRLYSEQKLASENKSLSIIIDEAHNVLSTESFREAESWKDYRLETFEEIIKEGRKFGTFVTIASQRPNDISATITSQAHNYFIHRLINDRDLRTIASVVSYIDKVTEESIPTLPTGTCIFSGVASQMPLRLNVRPLDEDARPKSATRAFSQIVSDQP